MSIYNVVLAKDDSNRYFHEIIEVSTGDSLGSYSTLSETQEALVALLKAGGVCVL